MVGGYYYGCSEIVKQLLIYKQAKQQQEQKIALLTHSTRSIIKHSTAYKSKMLKTLLNEMSTQEDL